MKPSGKEVTLLPSEPESSVSIRTWMVAAFAILLVAGIAAMATLHRSSARAGEVRGADGYAPSLPITSVQMSEATNGTGGKATYVDGTVANTGGRTLTGALAQVTFHTADGAAPYREIVPLALIRIREPYVDLQPLGASPLAPSQTREFRLIFESVPSNWDSKPPEIQVIHTDLK